MSKYEMVQEILEKAPVAGLYLNQSPAQWEDFFKFYCRFLLTEEGPRGEAAKLCREYLEKDLQTTTQLLKPLGLYNKDYLPRDVYVKFKQYIPTPLYTRYQLVTQKLRQIQSNTKLIQDINSLMYKNIEKGLLEKHGKDYDIDSKMREVAEMYIKRLTDKKEQVQKLEVELKSSEEYQLYERMRKYFQPVVELFDKVEKKIGNSSVERGKIFEQRCLNQGLEQVYSRVGRNSFQVVTNCRWDPQQLGEVDIALIETFNGAKTVTVLVECKARLFDLCTAVKQVGPERIQKNKRSLKVGKELLPVLDNAEYFIMTGLPNNEFNLPFQSRMKAQLEKATKAFAYAELDSKTIYNLLLPKFQKERSPLQWFKQQAAEHLIVI